MSSPNTPYPDPTKSIPPATVGPGAAVDAAESVNFGMDLTRLIHNPQLDPREYVETLIQRFSEDVSRRIGRFSVRKPS